MAKFTKNSLGIIESSIPFLYEDLYEKPKKYLISTAEIHEYNDDALAIIDSYNSELDESWRKLILSEREYYSFSGGIPILAGKENNYILKKTAFIKAIIHQTLFNLNDNRWLTDEQIEKYNLKLKENANPILFLWKRAIGYSQQLELVYTKLYHIEDVVTIKLKDMQTFAISEFDFETTIKEIADEYDIKIEDKTFWVNADGEIFRNEGFLDGGLYDYVIRIPNFEDFEEITSLQSGLLGLTCFLARRKILESLHICNGIGYFIGCVLINQLMPEPKYIGSDFHLQNLRNNMKDIAIMSCEINDILDLARREIFEIGEYINTIIQDKSLIIWLQSEEKRTFRKKAFNPSSDFEQAEITKRIRRKDLNIWDVFKEKLDLRMTQSSISVLKYLPDYVELIRSQLQRVLTERDLNEFPDEYEFYLKFESGLLDSIVSELIKIENLDILWNDFELNVIKSSLPEPRKDFIIKKKAAEYRNFIKYILFSCAEPDSVQEMANKILKL